jgi:hypothetical protein
MTGRDGRFDSDRPFFFWRFLAVSSLALAVHAWQNEGGRYNENIPEGFKFITGEESS